MSWGAPSSHARCFFTGNHIDYFLYYYIHVCKEKSNPFEINTRTQANFINVFTPDFNKTLNNNMIIETPYIERQLRCSASKQKRLKNMKNIKKHEIQNNFHGGVNLWWSPTRLPP